MHTGHLPYVKLFLHGTHSIALAADGHIQVLDSSTGTILHTTTTNEQKEKVVKSGPVVAASVDESFAHLVTATSDKTIRVWEIAGLRVVSEREAPKKPTDVCFTHDAQTVLNSDKFGDVHSYPLLVSSVQETPAKASASKDAKPVTKSAKRMSDGSLLLGHVSLLTTLLLSRDEKYIITADRDEHIRVSWYPEAYTIERYCLEHKKFVSALHIPSWDPSLLVSGGGDPMLKIWDWMEGKVVREIDIVGAVIPFVKVVREKSRRMEGDGDDDDEVEVEGDGAAKLSSRQKRKNRKRGKGKEREDSEAGMEGSAHGNGEGDSMEVDEKVLGEVKTGTPAEEADSKDEGSDERLPNLTPVLAVQKILAFEVASSKFLVFSAHGATALFYCKFPDLSDSSSEAPSPDVRSLSLDQPVLDFTIWPNANEIWVSVDASWTADGSSLADGSKSVRIIKLDGDELISTNESVHQALAYTLNTTGRLEATPETLKQLDLYSALTILPKNVDVEHNAMDEDAPLSEATGGQLTGKELGRLKAKKAVLARQAALTGKRDHSETPEQEHSIKRQKSETAADAE
ncbi:hypothetical protein M0805_004602 [Coniferiporia weirii]|nr:hypothetical protein M0805_004602 [Coniferiporia weirii]